MWRKLAGWAILQAVRGQVRHPLDDPDPTLSQQDVLRRLMQQAQNTLFGKTYQFEALSRLPDGQLADAYRQAVPLFTYEQMYGQWWARIFEGEEQVCWPEHISFMAHSSGTTAASAKMIPVSPSMIQQTLMVSRSVLKAAPRLGVDTAALTRPVISIGAPTALHSVGDFQCGMFSGIVFGHTPSLLRRWFKPEPEGYNLPDWESRLHYIVQHAPQWDIGAIYGFPCWVTPMLERIVTHYGVHNITDIWPNLNVYAYSGMSIAPYREALRQMMGGRPVWIESYVASEGYFAFQMNKESAGMRLLTNWSVYYEFVPFQEQYFEDNGQPRSDAEAIGLKEVQTGVEYAMVITNNSGAWRYVLGDTIVFTSVHPPEIRFAGRTAHFINETGERLSLGNLEMAFTETCTQTGLKSCDFTVLSHKNGNAFTHIWYVESVALPDDFTRQLDTVLQRFNADYRHIRKSGLLTMPEVKGVAPGTFHRYMRDFGRDNGQSKIVRVLKGAQAGSWLNWLEING